MIINICLSLNYFRFHFKRKKRMNFHIFSLNPLATIISYLIYFFSSFFCRIFHIFYFKNFKFIIKYISSENSIFQQQGSKIISKLSLKLTKLWLFSVLPNIFVSRFFPDIVCIRFKITVSFELCL